MVRRLNSDSNTNDRMLAIGVLTLCGLIILYLANVKYLLFNYEWFPFVPSAKLSHYYINYFDFGFVKRGLVGSLLKAAVGEPSVFLVGYVALAIAAGICFLASYAVVGLRSRVDKTDFYLLAGLILFNPATIANIGYDLGRFDQALILYSIISFYYQEIITRYTSIY